MRVVVTDIPDVLILEPEVFGDARGFFLESFNSQRFSELVCGGVNFVQDNHSRSQKNVLRGLHYQISPKAQGKLVRVVNGAVFDVAVDIRTSSPTYGRWTGAVLSAENNRQMWIPVGFAHGFLTLTDTADFLYKTTDYYSPQHERSIRWNDPTINVKWPLENAPIVSARDAIAPLLSSGIVV